jgi:hypothetical protein
MFEHLAEIIVVRSNPRLVGDGALDELSRALGVSGLKTKQAEELKRVGVIRFPFEYLLEKRSRPRELPEPKQSDRHTQHLARVVDWRSGTPPDGTGL